jgi:hypothetical protein
MKKTLIIFLVTFCLLSCKQDFNVEKYDITKIEVHHISFDLLFPTQMDEESTRNTKSYIISDDKAIDNITEQIKSLSKSKSTIKFNKNQVYLVCDFYSKEGKSFTLMFDKNTIDINGKSYDENESLINSLIKKGSVD